MKDYYGSVIGTFESDYRDIYKGSRLPSPLSEAEFYTKVNENINKYNINKIDNKFAEDSSGKLITDENGKYVFDQENYKKVYEGIYYDENGQFINSWLTSW